MKSENRNPAMDVIRCFALLCVVGVHFFLHNGYYYQPMVGKRMYVLTLIRCFELVCVPLFLMLSGYLMGTKRPSVGYYVKIVRIIGIYLLASAVCDLYRWQCLGEPLTLSGILERLLRYMGSNYGWYIEMYIGLFLLIPYLNILLDGLTTQKQMLGLIGTLLALTALPSVINIYNWSDPDWWRNPASSGQYMQLIPQWWTRLYPVTYYVLGAYLRKYPLKLGAAAHILLLCAVTVFTGTFVYYRSYGTYLVGGRWQDSESLLVVLQSVLLFSFLQQRSYRFLNSTLRRVIAKVSEWSLGAYLVSWVLDDAIYSRLAILEPDPMARMIYMPLTVCGNYLLSILISGVLHGFYHVIEKAVTGLFRTAVKS